MKKIYKFRYMGLAEGGARLYSWINRGRETQPWMTRVEAYEFARRNYGKAEFEEQDIHYPKED